MRPVVFRLVLCAGLFAVWMGYLGYLVATRPRTPQGTPLVLSQPQVLASDVDIIARIEEEPTAESEVTVVEVLYPADANLKKGDKIKVGGLDECQAVQRQAGVKPPKDWAGPGEYLVPLRQLPGRPDEFEVAAVPPSPGFERAHLVRIYPATPEARAQYRRLVPPDKEGQPQKRPPE